MTKNAYDLTHGCKTELQSIRIVAAALPIAHSVSRSLPDIWENVSIVILPYNATVNVFQTAPTIRMFDCVSVLIYNSDDPPLQVPSASTLIFTSLPDNTIIMMN